MPRWLGLTLAALTAPIWGSLLLVAALLGWRFVYRSALYLLVWTYWLGTSPRRVLFVYSDSPHWKAHVESDIIPHLPEGTVVLNWSERRRWRRSRLEVRMFYTFAGPREYNPIGLVFERWRPVEDFRFWRAFRDAKHGRRGALEHVQTQLLRRVQ